MDDWADQPVPFGALDPLDELSLAIDAFHASRPDLPGVVTGWVVVAVVSNALLDGDEEHLAFTTPHAQSALLSGALADYASRKIAAEIDAR